MNSFGRLLRFTSFGESHGACIGVLIDGFLPNFPIDFDLIKADLKRRASRSSLTTPRHEHDEIEVLSGIYEGKSIGAPIVIIVRNMDARARDYAKIFRPSHADYTYYKKYETSYNAGGGRSSARESIARVIAGSFAKMLLREVGISVCAGLASVGSVIIPKSEYDFHSIKGAHPPFDILNTKYLDAIKTEVKAAKKARDSIGGSVALSASFNSPLFLGEPLYDKLDATLASALMGINGVKAVEIGAGVLASRMHGSEYNDEMGLGQMANVDLANLDSMNFDLASFDSMNFHSTPYAKFFSNNSGGITGGISNGANIRARVTFKPTPSIGKSQRTLTHGFNEVDLELGGRHDPCIALRASVIVEAMAAFVLADMLLASRAYEKFKSHASKPKSIERKVDSTIEIKSHKKRQK